MKAAAKPVARGAGEVRIVGGQWKRTRLAVPDLPGLRPTPDRVRETLFNWLGQDLSGWHCFDAFAGTGALGFECASRGAAAVRLCEQAPALVAALTATQARLGAEAVTVTRGDGVAQLRREPPHRLDLVLLDPPFGSDLYAAALPPAVAALRDSGFIYLESDRAWTEVELQPHGLVLHRAGRAGMVHFHLLKKVATA